MYKTHNYCSVYKRNIDCLNIRVMVVSIGSRGSHIPAMTPRRKRLGVIAGMWDPLDPIETTMTLIAVNISLLLILLMILAISWSARVASPPHKAESASGAGFLYWLCESVPGVINKPGRAMAWSLQDWIADDWCYKSQ